MEFIREKIKEKPISKKKIFARIGVAALCGFVFSIVVIAMMFIFMPIISNSSNVEVKNTEEETEGVTETEETQNTEQAVIIPPNLNLSLSDYQVLQDELYEIGNRGD